MTETTSKQVRLESLDALRGFDMLWIIGGGRVINMLAQATNTKLFNTLSNQMQHVPWEGFHFEDLIMPLFLFMVGMSIPFSVDKRSGLGESKRSIYLHAFRRGIIFLLVGMAYGGTTYNGLLTLDINQICIFSVLGNIGICYFLATLIYTMIDRRTQVWLVGGILFAYWCILTFIPVPGQKAGLLLPDSNIVRYVEHLVLGRFAETDVNYMWLLDTGSAVCTVMTGVFAANIIRGNVSLSFIKSQDTRIHKTLMLGLIGSVSVILSLLLNIWFPIIKNIWTPSFVFLTSGLSFLLMALFYFVIDVKGYKRWAFWLKVIGMNAITVYLGVRFIPFRAIADNLIFGLKQFVGGYYPVIQAMTTLTIIYIIMYILYKRKIFLKI